MFLLAVHSLFVYVICANFNGQMKTMSFIIISRTNIGDCKKEEIVGFFLFILLEMFSVFVAVQAFFVECV